MNEQSRSRGCEEYEIRFDDIPSPSPSVPPPPWGEAKTKILFAGTSENRGRHVWRPYGFYCKPA